MSGQVPLTRLGRTALTVSRLGFGGGSNFCTCPEADADAAVAAALAAGIRYFDTAPFYGHGLGEHRIGRALRGVPRDSYVLSTKVGRLLRPDAASEAPGRLPFAIRLDYTRDGVLRSLEDSLQRLGLTRIDIVYIHDVTPAWVGDEYERRFAEAMDGAYPALAELRAAGTVGAIGAGIKDWDACLRFARAGDFDVFMLAGGLTLLEQGSLAEFLPHCVRHGIAVVLAAPFNSGILATGAKGPGTFFYRPPPPEVLERTCAIEAVCTRHGMPLHAAALHYPLSHPAVAAVVAGHQGPAEVGRNVAALAAPPPAALWEELRARGLLPEA